MEPGPPSALAGTVRRWRARSRHDGGGICITIEASTEIKPQVRDSSITIGPAQIEVKSPTVIVASDPQKIVLDGSGIAGTGLQIKLNG